MYTGQFYGFPNNQTTTTNFFKPFQLRAGNIFHIDDTIPIFHQENIKDLKGKILFSFKMKHIVAKIFQNNSIQIYCRNRSK